MGYDMEADPRHAELIIEQLLEPEARTLSTPGSNTEVSIDDAKELEGEEATRYRAIAARCNYLSMDRPDLQFSVKELCREMSRPTDQAWARLRRVGQFIKSRPRVVWKFQWQDQAACVDVYADANWAGCRRTRKSTSGGCTIQLHQDLVEDAVRGS